MKKWLTDFQHGDKARDLYPYFTPVLSYVEGSWRKVDGDATKIVDDDVSKVRRCSFLIELYPDPRKFPKI